MNYSARHIQETDVGRLMRLRIQLALFALPLITLLWVSRFNDGVGSGYWRSVASVRDLLYGFSAVPPLPVRYPDQNWVWISWLYDLVMYAGLGMGLIGARLPELITIAVSLLLWGWMVRCFHRGIVGALLGIGAASSWCLGYWLHSKAIAVLLALLLVNLCDSCRRRERVLRSGHRYPAMVVLCGFLSCL